MGVDIDDLRDRSRSIHTNWWQWRPTVELIRSLGLFDDERLDVVVEGIGEFNQEETHRIAELLELNVLPRVQANEQVLIDGSVTDVPDDGTFHREQEQQHRNYRANRDWLVEFIAFCKSSNGIYIC